MAKNGDGDKEWVKAQKSSLQFEVKLLSMWVFLAAPA
jgi:hypothetical protein